MKCYHQFYPQLSQKCKCARMSVLYLALVNTQICWCAQLQGGKSPYVLKLQEACYIFLVFYCPASCSGEARCSIKHRSIYHGNSLDLLYNSPFLAASGRVVFEIYTRPEPLQMHRMLTCKGPKRAPNSYPYLRNGKLGVISRLVRSRRLEQEPKSLAPGHFRSLMFA